VEVSTLLKKIRRAGTIDRQPASGRPRSVCVNENIENVEDLVFSQDRKTIQKRTDWIVRSHVKLASTDRLYTE